MAFNSEPLAAVDLQLPLPRSEDLSMSSRSTPASELGRLALAGQGSSDSSEMGVTTRNGAKRQAQAQASSGQGASRASGGGGDSGKQRAISSASTPTGQSGRAIRATRELPGDDDDDSDEEESDGSDEDSGDDGEPSREPTRASAAPQNPRVAIGEMVFKIFSIFEPNQHSYAEMKSPNLLGRPEASAEYRQLAMAVSSLVKTHADVKLLTETIDVQGSRCSRQIATNMERRWGAIHNDFRLYWTYTRAGTPGHGTDAEGTIAKIKTLFAAIEDTLQQFPMRNGTQQRLVNVLTEVFETLPSYYQDARSPTAAAPTFAGGATQFEYNLFLRFVCIKTNYLQCLQVLRRISEYDNQRLRPLIRENRARWSNIYRNVHGKLSACSWPGDSGHRDGFVSTLHNFLTAWGIPPT